MPIEFTSNPLGLKKKLDFVVCHRVKDLPIPKQAAEIVTCFKCSERIWRGITSPTKPPTICMQCVEPLMEKDDKLTMYIGERVAGGILNGTVHPDLQRLIEIAVKSK